MAIAFVNSVAGETEAASDASHVTSAMNVSAGNLIVVGTRFADGGSTTVSNVQDTAGNTYVSAAGLKLTYSGDRLEVWYALNATAHATNVITVNYSEASTFKAILAAQYSGVATSSALDAAATGTVTATTPTVTSGSFSTIVADEVIVAVAQCNSIAGSWTPAAIGGTTATERVEAADGVMAFADRIVSATQSSITAAYTQTEPASTNASIVVATFKAAATGTTISPAQGTATLTGTVTVLAKAILMPDEL